MNEYIPLAMLLGFGGILFGFGLLVLKGIERQTRHEEDELQRDVRSSRVA